VAGTGSHDPKRSLEWVARQRIGGPRKVILVVSNRDPYGLTRNAVDISAWLRELGLERYEQAFQRGEIDPAILPELTDADLKELGIPLGPRKQLLKAISALAAGLGPRRREIRGDPKPSGASSP
jgi:SAM domain (Sterile alpha motif)